jgi:glyoxylase-like metal-dependent hydrolase (beta-lactamase superfamily II)
MIIETVTVGAFAENCYAVGCPVTREGLVLDPGDEPKRIYETIARLGLQIKFILLTHAHIDHVKELKAFQALSDAPIMMHKADEFLLQNLPNQAAAFGLTSAGVPAIDRFIDEGETIRFGEQAFSVFHTPGHSPGSITFTNEDVAFVGDVLFAGSIGRTDLPGGDLPTLLASIRDKLLPLGDTVTVYPGHGPATTIGTERVNNPFLQGGL